MIQPYLGGGFKYFLCSTLKLGKIFTHFDDHIFQMGWFNHQLEKFVKLLTAEVGHSNLLNGPLNLRI